MQALMIQGFQVRFFDEQLGEYMETLYAHDVFTGAVLQSDTHKPSSLFHRKGAQWQECDRVPPGAEFIGNYRMPRNW